MICSYCESNHADEERIFSLNDEKMGFCSLNCTDNFKSHISDKDKIEIRSHLCCGNPKYANSRGYVVCTKCGTIIDDKIFDSGPEFQKRERMSIKKIEAFYSFLSYLVD